MNKYNISSPINNVSSITFTNSNNNAKALPENLDLLLEMPTITNEAILSDIPSRDESYDTQRPNHRYDIMTTITLRKLRYTTT